MTLIYSMNNEEDVKICNLVNNYTDSGVDINRSHVRSKTLRSGGLGLLMLEMMSIDLIFAIF